MKDLLETIRDICFEIANLYEGEKREKAIMAYQKYNEYLIRLDKRYAELLRIEKAKELIDLNELKNQNRTLEDLQLEFVDKTEAFHQQVYATLSAFVLLLSHVAGKKYKGQLPINSVTKFLNHLEKDLNTEQASKYIKFLRASTTFRSKYIDHPQQHVLHDWMTFSYGSGTCIIYFIPDTNAVYIPGSLNPFEEDFRPPIACKDFYVSPSHEVVYECTKRFTTTVLESISKETLR